MELTDKDIQLLAQLSRDRVLYADCKGADLDALQELGLLQWFDARSSTTPFKEDPRPLFKLLLMSGRIDYFWVEPVGNWRELVGPELAAKVDAIDEIEWAVNIDLVERTPLVMDPTLPSPISAPFTRNAPKIAFSALHPRSRNGRPFTLISSCVRRIYT
jgi:hypothetical protein